MRARRTKAIRFGTAQAERDFEEALLTAWLSSDDDAPKEPSALAMACGALDKEVAQVATADGATP